MIRLAAPEIMKLNSHIVLDGACDDNYDDLWASLSTLRGSKMKVMCWVNFINLWSSHTTGLLEKREGLDFLWRKDRQGIAYSIWMYEYKYQSLLSFSSLLLGFNHSEATKTIVRKFCNMHCIVKVSIFTMKTLISIKKFQGADAWFCDNICRCCRLLQANIILTRMINDHLIIILITIIRITTMVMNMRTILQAGCQTQQCPKRL